MQPGFDPGSAASPRPLTPLERHEIFYHIQERSAKGEEGMAEFGNIPIHMVYDGNAILITKKPVPIVQEILAKWNPDTGHAIPSFHFGTVASEAEALDEDTRGRQVTLKRFVAQLEDAPRPFRFRASLTPIVDRSLIHTGVASNKFTLVSAPPSLSPPPSRLRTSGL